MTKWKEQRKMKEREREKEIQNAPFIHVLGKTSGEGREQNHRGNNSLVLSKGVERRVSCSFETTWKSPLVGTMGE